jgi:cystathionine beta-lyase/cystathionine gamma-synthase
VDPHPETVCSQNRRAAPTGTAPLVPPIVQSAAFIQADPAQAERVYCNQEAGYTYAREGHPNAAALAARLAELEHTEAALITGSGMAAIAAVFASLLRAGDRVVASDQLYGRSTALLRDYLSRFGVETQFVDVTDPSAFEVALASGARLAFFEMVSNPLLRIADAPTLTRIAHEQGALVAIDNTIATPLAFRPAEHGADLVVHSLTKLVAGHSDVTLGAVCATRDMITSVAQTAVTWGFTPSPLECWLAERGLGTLHLRLERCTRNAAQLADALANHPRVRRVLYPGRADHPDHAVAQGLFVEQHGNMVSFEVEGGTESVTRLFLALERVPFSPTLGHLSTIVSHPASTSHRGLAPEERARLGIDDALVRVSVGVEYIDDIRADFIQALDAVG